MVSKYSVGLGFFLVVAGSPALAATTISFDEAGPAPGFFAFSPGPLTNQYSSLGVTFSGGWHILDDSSWFAAAVSGVNVLAYNIAVTFSPQITNTLTIDFSTPFTSFSAYVGAFTAQTWNYQVFSSGVLKSSGAVDNLAEFYAQISVSGKGDRIVIAGSGPAGVLDDLNFSTAVVPEPSTWMLMILGFGLIAQQLRRRHLAAA